MAATDNPLDFNVGAPDIIYEPQGRGSKYKGRGPRGGRIYVKRTELEGGVIEWQGIGLELLMENLLERAVQKIAVQVIKETQLDMLRKRLVSTKLTTGGLGFAANSFYLATGPKDTATYNNTPKTGSYESTKFIVRAGERKGKGLQVKREKLDFVGPTNAGDLVIGNSSRHFIYIERDYGILESNMRAQAGSNTHAILRETVKEHGGP